MSFLGNDAVNRVNLHTGIVAFARGAGDAFFTAVLLKAGVPLAVALAAQGGVFLGRLIIRPLIVPFVRRYGLKPPLIAGTIGMGLHYPLLPHIEGAGPLLWLMLAIVAVAQVLYFPTYHTYFATLGDVSARGRQIAVREMFNALSGVLAPLVGTWALVTAGPEVAFLGAAAIQISAVIPLVGLGNANIPPNSGEKYRPVRLGLTLMALDGWYNAFLIAWGGCCFSSSGATTRPSVGRWRRRGWSARPTGY